MTRAIQFALATAALLLATLAPAQTVSISVNPASLLEDGTPNFTYTVTRSPISATPTTVNITTTGTATSSVDYTGGVLTVVIPANSATATITLNPTADTILEPDETVILTVAPGSYTVGSPSSATGTIQNDE
ncbi:MAG: hypothetical protein MUE46_18110, partial [Xanthomonadales bacterium]|nr:hypothetical protein [Xanthomonadales bacterium]